MKTASEHTPNVASFHAVRRELQYCRPVAKQSFCQCAKCLEGERWPVASSDLDFDPAFRRYQPLRRDVNGPGARAVLGPELTGHSHGVSQGERRLDRLCERHPADFDTRKQTAAEIRSTTF